MRRCNKLTALIGTLLLALLVCTGCGEEGQISNENTLSVSLADHIPKAYVDESYDLSLLVAAEENVEYTYTASYMDPATGETQELKVRKGKITPKAEADISVTVTAVCGEDTASAEFVVPVHISADIMDELLASDGAAGQADAGVAKTVTKEGIYIYGDSSTSALAVRFSNPAAENEGTNLLNLSHYALQAYYSAQVWRNVAVSFWVYNPMEQAVSFKLISHNPENNKTLLWDSTDNTQVQTAQAGQWTQIVFSLYDMGITQPLLEAVTYSREDSLKLYARYAGSDVCTVYIDCLDILHADTVEGLKTGYVENELPAGDYTDLLKTCRVYTEDAVAKLTTSSKGNGSNSAYCFGTDQKIGYPTFFVDFPKVTDISGFDYLKFDVLAENCYPFVSVAIRYLDENGEVQKHGTSYDFYREQWQTLYVNLDYLKEADLTQAIGLSITIHADAKFVANAFNCVYFDNLSLYDYPGDEPQMLPATAEDHDIISGPFYTTNTKLNTNGVCKVATDETGLQKSNSTLLFWTNNASGYPRVDATFLFAQEQDWSNYNVLSFDAHQYHGHYWMRMTILYLDENDKQQTLTFYHDTVLTNWQTVNVPLEWFKTESGESAKPEYLKRVVGFRIAVDMAVNVSAEVAHIYFDNFILS